MADMADLAGSFRRGVVDVRDRAGCQGNNGDHHRQYEQALR